jgi:hypothetical protein
MAAMYGERIIIPKVTMSCSDLTSLPARGGIVLIRQDHGTCALGPVLDQLARQAGKQHLHPTALRDLTT